MSYSDGNQWVTPFILRKEGLLVIRKASLEDIPALQKIYNDAVLHTTATYDTEIKDYADRLRWYEQHETEPYVLFVEEIDKTVAGYASLSQYRERRAFDPSVEISVYVDEAFQNQGVGSSLMKAVLDYAKNQKCIHTVVSLITSENEHSIYLHEKLGFSYCGKIKDAGYKFGRWIDLSFYQIIYQRE